MSSAQALADLPDVPPIDALPELVPPATREEARARSIALARLLRAEREVAADFLLGLADFDRRRGWEALGYRSLFDFLVRDLGLSLGAASLRLTAARLLPKVPEVEAALRRGTLCLSAVGELAKVVTPSNQAEVLPRFLGRSAREAREVAATLVARPDQPTRDLIRPLSTTPVHVLRTSETGLGGVPALERDTTERARPQGLPASGAGRLLEPQRVVGSTGPGEPCESGGPGQPGGPGKSGRVADRPLPSDRDLPSAPGHEPLEELGTAPRTHAPSFPRDDFEPLDAARFRLHATVSRRFLEKVSRARVALSHRVGHRQRASLETVLEAALDALIARSDRAHRLGPRAAQAVRTATVARTPSAAQTREAAPPEAVEPAAVVASAPGATGASIRRRGIPAAVEREVRLRDGERCQFAIDSGGVCGATHRVELDHRIPLVLGGETSAANLRCLCGFHHRLETERLLGRGVAGLRAPKGRPL